MRWVFAMMGVLGLQFSICRADVPVAKPASRPASSYPEVIQQTAAMVGNQEAQRLAQQYGLQVMNVTWEDTGRFKNSAVGPNISDMSIQVQDQGRLTLMPVIRYPNFEDKSADINPAKFFLLVGNEKGKDLQRVSLAEFLGNIRKYLSKPGSWKGYQTYMLANRDTHVLVSAQACFLPVPKEGIAEFTPVLFNYQALPEDPAVLSILATREGTSVTIIDNKRDTANTAAWGQRLYFNKNGERAVFTGKRLSEFLASPEGQKTQPTTEAAGQKGLNMVLLIQVPLKQKTRQPEPSYTFGMVGAALDSAPAEAMERKSDVEAAVIGHGKVEGPFTEIDNLAIERDERFPVRVTVQFYKATSNGVVSAQDMAEVAEQIKKVYAEADYVGSLVTDGNTGRPTEHDGEQVEPPDWWARFWADHERNTGYSRTEVVSLLREEHGAEWFPMTEKALASDAKVLKYPENRMLRRTWLHAVGPYGRAMAVLAVVAGVVALVWRRKGQARLPV